jgi:hypothetical protein
VKRSEFDLAVEEEFGRGYASVVVDDLALGALDGRTAREALAAGDPTR